MDYWILAVTVLIGIISLYRYFFNYFTFFKKHDIPYVTPVPILGNSAGPMCRLESFANLIQRIYNCHPDAKYVGFYDMTVPTIFIRDPELIKQIGVKHFDSFVNHRGIDDQVDPLFGKNLFALRNNRWREVRNLLSPAFTTSKMRNMFKLMNEYAIIFVDFLCNLPPDKSDNLDIKDAFTRYTNDVIATCAYGISVDSMRNPNNEFYVLGRDATVFTFIRFLKFGLQRSMPRLARLLRLSIFSDEVRLFFKDVVQTTIRTRDEKGIVRPDMIQLMMESRGKEGAAELSIDDMVSQAFVFFFGGFESTSTTMCFTVHELAVNPETQQRLREEIDEVLEKNKGQVTYEAINEMEYLDAVVNESMRMYPVAVAADRVCNKEFELPPTLPGRKPFLVTKDMNVWFPLYGLHHDPKYFEEPEKFKPERFLGDGKELLHSGAFLPFGIGPRMCIGNRFALLETKVLLFHLFARCEVTPSAKTAIPLKLSRKTASMTAENGFWLKVKERKNSAVRATNGTANGN